jgi:hypothetical protein
MRKSQYESDKPLDQPPERTAKQKAKRDLEKIFSGSDPVFLNRDSRRWLLGIVWSFLLIPAIFYLQFGVVGPLGWGLTIFLSVVCLLIAGGFHFQLRPQYHTPVAMKNDWLDRIGSLWLVVCGFGPLLGWVLINVFTLTLANWQWLYWARVILSIVLPVLTMLPLLRYARGPGAPIMLAILLGITALPIWSGWTTLRDLQSGPVTLLITDSTSQTSKSYLHLPNTRKVLIESKK